MELDALLTKVEAEVLDEAYAALHARSVTHYELAGEGFTRERLADLFALVVTAIRSRNLVAIGSASEQIATERFNHGYDISEVQMAFNALEEAMWRRVVATGSPDELAESIGLLSTVLGYGKDAVARTYISLASRRRVPSLDLSALFEVPDATAGQ